eukprot:SAG11_NODE_1582_length_4646_cov_3.855949_5_plen_103_part_00
MLQYCNAATTNADDKAGGEGDDRARDQRRRLAAAGHLGGRPAQVAAVNRAVGAGWLQACGTARARCECGTGEGTACQQAEAVWAAANPPSVGCKDQPENEAH